MLNTGRILRCGDCGRALGVIWDEPRDYLQQGTVNCDYCAKSELLMRGLCGFEKPQLLWSVLYAIFNRKNQYREESKATVQYSNVCRNLTEMKLRPGLFPENFKDDQKNLLDKNKNSVSLYEDQNVSSIGISNS